ncbi:MAG: hypothetical protein ACP5NZ_01710 [Nanobdellota archaeon]
MLLILLTILSIKWVVRSKNEPLKMIAIIAGYLVTAFVVMAVMIFLIAKLRGVF